MNTNKIHRLSLWCALLGLSVGLTGLVFAEGKRSDTTSRERVVAQVNDESITNFQVEEFHGLKLLDEEFRRKLIQTPFEERERFVAKTKTEALDELIDQNLLLQEAEKLVEMQPFLKDEIEFYLKQHMKRLEKRLGLATLQKALKKRDKSVNEYKKEQRKYLTQTVFLERKIYGNVYVSPNEIKGYYDSFPKEFSRKVSLRYRQIWIHQDDDETGTLEKAKALAMEIRKKLTAGADFSKLWERYSYDRFSDKNKGGLREAPDYAKISPALADELKKIPERQLSEVLPHGTKGWRILWVESQPRSFKIGFEESQQTILRKLRARKRREERVKLVKKLREKAYIRYFPQKNSAER